MGKIPSSEFRLRSFKYQWRASKSRSRTPLGAVTGQLRELRDNRETALGAVTDEPGEISGGTEITKWIRNRALALHITQESYADPKLQSVVCIFTVPNFLKELNIKAYVPQAVSLGPYHHNRANLSGMDHHKKRALRRMMTRFNNMRGATDPNNLEFSFRAIEKIFQDVGNIKNSYEEEIECKPESLAVMLTLDGCFLLEILRTLGGDDLIWEGSDKYEPIFDRNRIYFTGFDILNDILMLENQVPFTVLRNLLELEFNSVNNVEEFLLDVVVRVPGTRFYPFDYDRKDMERWSRRLPDGKAHHFLGLLHSLIVSPPSDDDNERAIPIDSNGKEKSGKDDRGIPCAVQLSNVCIKFQRCNGGIKQIYFDRNKATMFLPPINVTDHTEVLFRNLIALEVCQASGINYVTCYLSLMNNLIHTEEEIAESLKTSGILKNYLGSDAEVARLFNCLCRGITLCPKGVLEKLQDDVMDHYSNKLRVLIAQFVEDHLSPTWKVVGMLAIASLVLFLTLLQTIFSILQVYR